MADSDHDIVSIMEVIAEKTGWPLRNRARSTAAVSSFVAAARASAIPTAPAAVVDPLRPDIQPLFRFRSASARYKILPQQSAAVLEVRHDVVATRRCRVFQHSIDLAGDETSQLPSIGELDYDVEKRDGPSHLQVQLRFGRCTQHSIEYFIEVIPELRPNEQLGYWRRFRLPNTFPLTRAELRARARMPGFPPEYGTSMYGDTWDVLYDIDSISMALHFPREVRIASRGVRVFHYVTREEIPDEVERCARFVRLDPNGSASEHVLEMTVPWPKINHSYYLLYEPLD